jgi:single-strand DNA-binding protein
MATTFNKLVGIFRLGKDPETRYTSAGLAVTNFSGASDHSFKKNEEWQKETEWTRMVAFGKTAERIGEQLKKGSLVYVEGRLKTNKWEDKEGNTRYNTDVVINSINFLTDYTKKDYQPSDQYQGGGQTQTSRPQAPPAGPDVGDGSDDDIPF